MIIDYVIYNLLICYKSFFKMLLKDT